MAKKASLLIYALLMAGAVLWQLLAIDASYKSAGKLVTVQLTRGPYHVLDFPAHHQKARAVILFGSGDGGWSGFEEDMCLTLQEAGYEVMGINSFAYAKTDYDLATLQADYDATAQAARASRAPNPPPVIIGGWSMGAAQAIAAGGGPHPPRHLAGLLVVDPCGRGRYGLRLADRVDFLPTGPGTFAMDEFDRSMGNIRIVQWHAAQDSIDSRTWLAGLTAPHREYDFAPTGHYYSSDRLDFLRELPASITWILSRDESAVSTTGSKP